MRSSDHIQICDASGKMLVSKIEEMCREDCLSGGGAVGEKFRCPRSGEMRRRGQLATPYGSAFLCTSDPNMVSSKRVFLRALEMYSEMVASLVEVQKLAAAEARRENRRLVHNLTTLNSHIIQEIYNIVPQDELAGRPDRQIALIADRIGGDRVVAAQAALKILKNAVAARTEMQIVRRFESAPQLPVQRRAHMVHKVIKNVLITFFQDSQERGIIWNLGSCAERVLVDYESVSAAMYRLFENFIKYCAPRSSIDIEFSIDHLSVEVIIEMMSIQILPGEEIKMFEDGYSGLKAREYELSGSGLGMSIVKQMLEVNNAAVQVVAGNRISVVDGVEYSPNRFVLSLPRAS